MNFIDSIRKKHVLSLLPIILDLGSGGFDDKLSYILLECICYHLIERENCKLYLNFSCKHTIFNEGIKYSYLKKLDGTSKNKEEFVKKFKKNIYKSHYRNLIVLKDADLETASSIVQDIDSFLKPFDIEEEYRASVSDVVGELIDNALEHSNSDCLVDLDVTIDYYKNHNEKSQERFCGINIVILNLSNVLIGDKIAKKIKTIDINTNDRYANLVRAHKYHSAYFSKNYTEKDFFAVASFQHKISSRPTTTGGTGLTQLIKALEEKSDAYNCYLLSGDRRLNLIKRYLTYDDTWIGFNDKNDFLNDIPCDNCFNRSNLYFPGTAYNLNFVLKREG